MLFGFFLRTNKTLRLPNKTHQLKNYPQFCCKGSKIVPHILNEVNQILPHLAFANESKGFIPLFVPTSLNSNTPYQSHGLTGQKFCLRLLPDTQRCPNTSDFIVKEYWSSIVPMVLCRDITGYYIGISSDPNIILFETCSEKESECWILSASEDACYGTNLKFGSDKIHLRKTEN